MKFGFTNVYCTVLASNIKHKTHIQSNYCISYTEQIPFHKAIHNVLSISRETTKQNQSNPTIKPVIKRRGQQLLTLTRFKLAKLRECSFVPINRRGIVDRSTSSAAFEHFFEALVLDMAAILDESLLIRLQIRRKPLPKLHPCGFDTAASNCLD